MGAFGNVPDDDVVTVSRLAAVASEVVGALPPEAPGDWVTTTYEAVLEATLRDWMEHETDHLEEEDVDDLENCVRVAADVALQQKPVFQSIAYKTLLKGLLADWVRAWGEEE